jgi:hypothetical protein
MDKIVHFLIHNIWLEAAPALRTQNIDAGDEVMFNIMLSRFSRLLHIMHYIGHTRAAPAEATVCYERCDQES